jgi:hypothetical protein
MFVSALRFRTPGTTTSDETTSTISRLLMKKSSGSRDIFVSFALIEDVFREHRSVARELRPQRSEPHIQKVSNMSVSVNIELFMSHIDGVFLLL